MSSRILQAAILSFGLILGGFLAGGRYTFVHTRGNEVARLDRYSGAVSMCVVGAAGDVCGWRLEQPR